MPGIFILASRKTAVLAKLFINLAEPGGFTRLFYLYSAVNRYYLFKKAVGLKKKGGVVVADRYPLSWLWNEKMKMDGPKIKGFGSRFEKYFYRKIKNPDVVLYLRVPLSTLEERDTKISAEMRARKFEACEQLTLQNDDSLKIIDAGQDAKKVLLDCQNIIWKNICQ